MIQILPNQNQLIFGGAFPLFIIQGKALATQMKDMTLGTFVKPENALGSKHILRQLVIQKVLELADIKGPVTVDRHGSKAIIL